MRTRIKICGFTRVQDALCAARLGVDALGLVFYPPSPRNVSIAQAVEIVRALPAFVSVVALFVDEQEQRIREVLGEVAIDLIQFHGDESAEYCRSFGKPYVKAVRMRRNIDIASLAKEYHDASGLLLDAYHANAKGGTGRLFDWEMIPATCPIPVILAGGLEPANAGLAVKTVKPYALDVSSGVEVSKGIKDIAKMSAFVNEVYQSDRT
jgi:phosphoribosylanthranilate isomerase